MPILTLHKWLKIKLNLYNNKENISEYLPDLRMDIKIFLRKTLMKVSSRKIRNMLDYIEILKLV